MKQTKSTIAKETGKAAGGSKALSGKSAKSKTATKPAISSDSGKLLARINAGAANNAGENLGANAGENAGRSSKSDRILIEGVAISSPERPIFLSPVVTKLQLTEYYSQVAERMLPHIKNRLISLVSCPKGVDCALTKPNQSGQIDSNNGVQPARAQANNSGQTTSAQASKSGTECFFKKHLADNQAANAHNFEVDGRQYFYLTTPAGIVSRIQNGAIELHTWGSRVTDLERPDTMVFDLDPDEGMEIERVRQEVRDLLEVLETLKLTAFIKTSGGKGYHVVVPLSCGADFDGVKKFAASIAELMAKNWPNRYTDNIRKASRKGKIFIDFLRCGRGATSVAPYSVRARAGAKVSMPIALAELDKVAPDGVDMAEAIMRLSLPDPWANFFAAATHQQIRK